MKAISCCFVYFSLLTLHVTVLYGGDDINRAEVELCDYHRPSVEWAVLPVYPEDPFEVGKKCIPVYDVMLNPSGKARLAQPVYSPGKAFDNSFMKMLQFRKYKPATEKGTPVVSMFRDVSFSYFYLKKDNESEKITKLPQSIWAMGSNMHTIASYMHRNIQIEVDIDEEGRIVDLRSLDFGSLDAKNVLYKGQFKKKLFIPAYAGENPVKCTLVHVVREEMGIPQPVKDGLLDNQGHSFEEITDTPLKLKVCYDQDGFVGSIVTEDSANMDLRTLWMAMSQLRSCKGDVEDLSDDVMYLKSIYEERVVFDPKQGNPTILYRQRIPFVFPDIVKRERPMFHIPARMPNMVNIGVMNFSVNEEGDVTDAELIICDDKWINKSVKNALMKWKFKPAVYDGKSISSIYRLVFDVK